MGPKFVSISSSLVLIVIMLLGALFIYQRIARSMQHLLTAAQLTDRPIVNENYAVADKEFIEIDPAFKERLVKIFAEDVSLLFYCFVYYCVVFFFPFSFLTLLIFVYCSFSLFLLFSSLLRLPASS